jgi:hypothetical protein
MAPQVLEHLGTWPTERMTTVDERILAQPVQPSSTDLATRAGDPFVAAGKRKGCPACFSGYVTIGLEEDGQERDEPVACRRCCAG